MKHFLFLLISAFTCTYAIAQDTSHVIRRTETRIIKSSTPLDTNAVVYDEDGKPLRFYQYQKLVNSGEYTIRFSGIPGDPGTKKFLKRLSVQEQNQRFEMMKKMMVSKSPVLQENMLLNVAPLLSAYNAKDLENKVLVLIFWNSECPPCTEAFASLNDFLKQNYNPEKLVVIALTRDKKSVAAAKLKEKPLIYSQLLSDAGSIINAYQVFDLPAYVVADKDRVIRFSTSGISTITVPALKNTIKSVLLN